jgi:hypothetical protein
MGVGNVSIGSNVNWIMYEAYLKGQDEEITKARDNYQKLLDAVGSEMGMKFADDSSVEFMKWFSKNSEGIKIPYEKIINTFFVENFDICRQLKYRQSSTYSKYSRIKTYGDRPVPAILLPARFVMAFPEGFAKVNKNTVNELTERFEKIMKNLNTNLNNINSLRNRFIRGEFGIEVKGGVTRLDTYVTNASDHLKLIRSKLNNAIVKSNTSANFSILK